MGRRAGRPYVTGLFIVSVESGTGGQTEYAADILFCAVTAELCSHVNEARGALMKFKDILVHIDNSPSCTIRLDLAVTLAKEHEARLTGIYVVTHAAYSPRGVRAKQEEEAVQSLFAEKTGEAGIRGEWLAADWGTVGVGMAEVLNYYAHTKDLIIVSQADPGVSQGDIPSDLAQRVVVGAGRPVLVVPYAGSFKSVGKRPIVAWKAGRVSARAVNDALPFLLNAEKVCVLSIKDPGEGESDSDGNLSANLECHDIKVKNITIVMKTIPVANLLMDFAWEHSRDLIVMGVYVKYSRGKYDLGPVARDFFDHMTLPVLMSH